LRGDNFKISFATVYLSKELKAMAGAETKAQDMEAF